MPTIDIALHRPMSTRPERSRQALLAYYLQGKREIGIKTEKHPNNLDLHDTMTENSIPSPMSMIKVDGAKIKRLREEQGLTQLYLATAVQVTTDTISRWENRRYPSIKKENGMKLAEALNVSLEDLLEEETAGTVEGKDTEDGSAIMPGEREPARTQPGKKIWPILLLVVGVACAVLAYIWFSRPSPSTAIFSAERILPAHCIAGQPFPVIMKIVGDPGKSTALIVRENIPPNATVKKITPAASAGGKKNEPIKWLRKINGTEIFAYVVKVSGKDDEVVNFSGTAAVSDASDESPPPIGGDTTIVIGPHHWADTDKDNVISDSEILSVYDQYGEIKGIDLDIDLIEEIWLGSGYKWNAATATFEIID